MPQSNNSRNYSPSPKPMVGWFDPRQLLRTAGEVIVSSIIGRHADRRLIEQLATQAYYFDFSSSIPVTTAVNVNTVKKDETVHCDYRRPERCKDGQDFWIDYVSDVGDGWNSTYAVARMLAQPTMKIEGVSQDLPRGDILIFGGDEVYPTASRDEYNERWALPYQKAFAGGPTKDTERPYAFAIPGNHDWYDSLASFSEMFSGSSVKAFPSTADSGSSNYDPKQGGWITPQTRSYFALKLPYDWWLFGVDLQLNHDVDAAQVKYFKEVLRNKVKDDDRVIFCSPEPFWVYCKAFPSVEEDYQKSRLKTLVEMTDQGTFDSEIVKIDSTRNRIKVYLAGDLHHYYRIRDITDGYAQGGVLKITAGGGGAFMHPTHGRDTRVFNTDFQYSVKAYPDELTSRRLAWGNMFFSVKNGWFNLVTGTLYLLTAWLLLVGIGDQGRWDLVRKAGELWQNTTSIADFGGIVFNCDAFKTFWGDTLLNNPTFVFLCILVLAGFWAFTDKNAPCIFRVVIGLMHGMLHLLLAGLVTWLGSIVFVAVGGNVIAFSSAWLRGWGVATLWVTVAGALLGASLIGVYLLLSLNLFGYHTGDGSSLKIEGYKNFLRLKLSADGSLTIYPLGLDCVPRWSDDEKKNEWVGVTQVSAAQPSSYALRQPERFLPHLIDGPLKYPLA